MRAVLRWLGRGALVLLALVVLALGAGYAWLNSAAGGRVIRERALASVNGAIAGRVEAEGVELHGARVVLRNVTLYTPEGTLVARVARLEASVSLAALGRGEVDVSTLVIEKPELRLVQDERGLNLVRAVEAKVPAASAPSSSPWAVSLRQVALEAGAVSFVSGASTFSADGLELHGDIALRGPPLAPRIAAQLKGTLREPVAQPFSVTVAPAENAAASSLSAFEFEAGEARVKGRLQAEPLALWVTDARLPRSFLAAWGLELPLRAPLELSGAWVDGALDVKSTVDGGALSVQVPARVKNDAPWVVKLSATGVEPSRWLESAPPGVLTASAEAVLTDTSTTHLSGSLDVQAELKTEPDTRTQLELHALAVQGAIDVKTLSLESRGVTLRAKGRGTPASVSLDGTLKVTNLTDVGATIGAFTGSTPPALAGSGSFEVHAEGPPRQLAVNAKGEARSLRLGSTTLEQSRFVVAVPDVAHPLRTRASISIEKVQSTLGAFGPISFAVENDGRVFSISSQAQGAVPMSFVSRGTVSRGAAAFHVESLEAHLGSHAFSLVEPADVSIDGAPTVSRLTLASGPQRLSFELRSEHDQPHLVASASELNLAWLPSLLVPASLGVAGLAAADLDVRGTWPALTGQAHVSVRDGRVSGLSDIGVLLGAELVGGAGTVHGSVKAPVGGAVFEAALPRALLEGQGSAELSATLKLDGVELKEVARALGQAAALDGTAEASVKVRGTRAAPEASVQVVGRQVRYAIDERRAVMSEQLNLGVELGGEAGARVTTAQVDAAFAGGTLRARLSSKDAFTALTGSKSARTAPLTWKLVGSAEGLDVEALEKMGLVPVPAASGLVSASFEASHDGTAPSGVASLQLKNFATPGVRPIDVNARLESALEATTAEVDVTREKKNVLHVGFKLPTTSRDLWAQRDWTALRFEAAGTLGPIASGALLEWADDERDTPRPDATLTGEFKARGTLGSPVGELRAAAQPVVLNGRNVGEARATFAVTDRTSTLTLDAASAAGGSLHLDAAVGAPVWKVAGLALGVPLEANATARAFDVSTFSGVLPAVRQLGGVLNLDAHLSGTTAQPVPRGELTWTNGRLSLIGSGEFNRINARLEFDETSVRVANLVAHAGSGTLEARGALNRTGSGRTVALTANLTQFPLVSDDQLRAILTTDVALNGVYEGGLLDAKDITIKRAEVELPEVKTRDLQDLERPRDIVIVRRGARVKKRTASSEETVPTRFRGVLNAPRNLWVRSSDVEVEIGLSDAFRVEYSDKVDLFGEVLVLRGKFQVIGRKFDVQKDARVRFSGSPSTPGLNVTAVHVNEKEQVTVFVTVTGRGKEMTLKATSQPPMPETEIYSLLATGRRSLKRGSGSSVTGEDAASVVGALAAKELKTALGKKLPLDVLSVEAGAQGASFARIEAGKYIGDRLYLGSVLQVGANPKKENNISARLELQLTRQWALEAFFGDNKIGGADVVWGVDF